MNRHPVDFGALQLEAVFERRDDFVDALHGQLVGQGAVAGDEDVVAGAADGDLMHIHNLGEERAALRSACSILRSSSTSLLGLLDGGRFALDMGQDRIDLRRLAQDLRLHGGDEVVRLEQRQGLVEFHMLLDAEASAVRLHAEIRGR